MLNKDFLKGIKFYAIILAVCVLMGNAVRCAASPLMSTAPKTLSSAEEAEEFIRILLSDEAASLDGRYIMSKPMEDALAKSGGFAGLAASLVSLGEAEKIGPAYESELAGQKIFRVPCKFSRMPLDLMFVMDGEALSGLSTVAYTGASDEGAEEEGEEETLFTSVELPLPVPALSGELPGTLTVPEGDGPFPAVVLIQGSGPSDQDETVMNLKPFRDLAEGLAKQGVAVYRFDKRTYVFGAVMAEDHRITLMDESIEDAVAAVQLLAAREEIDPGRIFVLGHSLGGMALPAIDGELKKTAVKAAGYIFMAASARPLDVLMREQYDFLYSLIPSVSEELQAQKDELFSELDKLRNLDALTEDDQVAGAFAPYWQWLADYDELETAKAITVPCLFLQGEEDYQVTMEDFRLWQENAELTGSDNRYFISYPGLTHPFIEGQKEEGSNVYTKNAKVAQQVIDDIAGFITGQLP